MTDQKPKLPEQFRDRVASFPESSMGANRITIELSNGRRIYAVYIAWVDEIVKVGDKIIEKMEDLDFDPSEITNVTSEV